MKHKQQIARSRAQNIRNRFFGPGWSGRFGAVMLTAVIATVVIAMSLGVA